MFHFYATTNFKTKNIFQVASLLYGTEEVINSVNTILNNSFRFLQEYN